MKRKPKLDWPEIAAAFAAQIPHDELHPGAMLTAFAEHGRVKRAGGRHPPRWAVAFSGGADSLALLLVLWAEGPGRWGRDFVALHFNHRLRGRAADADERFCVQVCAALGVKLVTGHWRTVRRGASESDARAARFDFFTREMKRRKLTMLWLGHQQDDIAETMLMRLARGSGTGGLAAPRPARKMPDGCWYMRPLLSLTKGKITGALQTAGAVWREDATNAGRDYFRNRVRRDVLPAWQKAAQRDALAGAALSRELLEEDDAALETWVGELRTLAPDGSLILGKLKGVPRALVRRALHRWLLAQAAPVRISRQAFDKLLYDVIQGRSTRQSMGRDTFAVIGKGRLRMETVGKKGR